LVDVPSQVRECGTRFGVHMSGSEGQSAAASVDFLAMVVLSARDAIVGEALDGTVLVWNRAAEQLYGYPAADMLGQRAERLYPAGGRADEVAAVRRVAGGDRLGAFVGERIRRDGTLVRVCVRAAPVLDSTGVTIGVATTSWAADAGSAGSPEGVAGVDLVRRVGHELRTPLNAITGFTGTLLMRLPGPLNDEQEHQLRLVQASAEQLLSRINQLSRPGEG
jgi:PAS domain S-box-containing protein